MTSHPDSRDRTIRLRGPADIVTTLPYHLGYQPDDSLLIIGLQGASGTRLGFVARVDLPPWGADPWPTVEQVGPLILAQHPERVLLVAYETLEDRAEPLSRAVRDALTSLGVAVAERITVRDGLYYGPDCTDGCCPGSGTAVPRAEDVPAVADYVLLGRVPLGGRDDVVRLVTPTGADDVLADLAALGELFRGRSSPPSGRRHLRVVDTEGLQRRALRAWASLMTGPGDHRPGEEPAQLVADGADAWSPASNAPEGPGPSCALGVLLAASLCDVDLRDLVITWICPGSLPLDRLDPDLVTLAEQALPPSPPDDDLVGPRLAALCRATPPAASAGPLTVTANVAWWHGDGALARSALDLALAQDPDYRLAQLLTRMLDLAIPPRRAAGRGVSAPRGC